MEFIWKEFLKIIKEEAGSRVVETWFKAVNLEKWSPDNKTVSLKVPNQFVSNWLQQHYTSLIKTHLSRLLHADNINLSFSCSAQPPQGTKDIIPAAILQKNDHSSFSNHIDKNEDTYNTTNTTSSLSTVLQKSNLPVAKKTIDKALNHINQSYHFDSFVVGPSNSLAHAASWAVCQNIGKIYNPLFIYGGTGLGKTHLLHAIGNESKERNPNAVIRYETSDRFINEFINSIRLDKTNQFRDKYQKTDLLLLDDIQFLSNKEQTQETFFHIFNILHEQGKQIIFSSDTFPKEISGLQARLRSRLEWGLVVDIQLPDLETKIAILKKKADAHSINLNDEVANFIASRITSNIRELEGALIRVGAFCALTNRPVTLEIAKRVLLQLNEGKKEGVMLDKVLKIIARHYSVSINDLKSKKRQQEIALVRQVAFYMMKKLTFCSLQAIGEFVGKRDHSTVLHAIAKVEKMLQKDPTLTQKLNAVEQEIISS